MIVFLRKILLLIILRGLFGYEETHKLATFRVMLFENELWAFNLIQNELILSLFKLLTRISCQMRVKFMFIYELNQNNA